MANPFGDELVEVQTEEPEELTRGPYASTVPEELRVPEKIKAASTLFKIPGTDIRAVDGGLTSEESDKEFQAQLKTLVVGAGKGLYDIGEAVGIFEQRTPFEKGAYEALEEERPIAAGTGEIAGQSAPFAAAGAPLAAIPSLLGRGLAMGALGAVEGGIISEAEGQSVYKGAGLGAAIAGGAEMVLPVIGSIAGKVYRRLKRAVPRGPLVRPDGTPTDEMAAALEEAGISWDRITDEAQSFIAQQPKGAAPEDVARAAGFESIGAPATRGEVTQEFAQQKAEQQLLEAGAVEGAEDLRALKRQQSQAMRGEMESIVDGLGIEGETGDLLKEALSGRRTFLKGERRKLYKELGEAATEAGEVPIVGTPILEAVPEERTVRRLARKYKDDYANLVELLTEFGLEQGEDAVAALSKAGVDVQTLGLHNFEDFRSGLIGIMQDEPGMGVIVGPMMDALDGEIDTLTGAIGEAGGVLAQKAKAARQSHRALMTEFDEKKITSKLIDNVKRGSSQPKIEASKAYNKVMHPGAPIEDLERVLESLGRAGGAGRKAIDAMRGQAVMDLVDSAFQASTRKIDGERVFGGPAFTKAYEKMLPKLEVLFADAPQELARLRNVAARAVDITPPAGAIPKGSAGFFVDALSRMGIYTIFGKVPMAREVLEIALKSGQSATARQTARKALKNKPRILEAARQIKDDFPQLSAAVGIAALIEEEE